eukprot:COSAG01_NODE_53548_length_338_cov_1.066946_1_plen_37_part_01
MPLYISTVHSLRLSSLALLAQAILEELMQRGQHSLDH